MRWSPRGPSVQVLYSSSTRRRQVHVVASVTSCKSPSHLARPLHERSAGRPLECVLARGRRWKAVVRVRPQEQAWTSSTRAFKLLSPARSAREPMQRGARTRQGLRRGKSEAPFNPASPRPLTRASCVRRTQFRHQHDRARAPHGCSSPRCCSRRRSAPPSPRPSAAA